MNKFLYRFFLVVLAALLTICINLLTGYFQNESLWDFFSQKRVIFTLLTMFILIIIISVMESKSETGFWRLYRYQYLNSLIQNLENDEDLVRKNKKNPDIIQIKKDGVLLDGIQFLSEKVHMSPGDAGCRVLILGEPGAGKTVAMKQLAYSIANHSKGFFNNGPIPVFLELRSFRESSFTDFIKKELEGRRYGKDICKNFKQFQQTGNIILLCDALDESVKAVSLIERFLSNVNYDKIPVILSGRTKDVPPNIIGIKEKIIITDLNDNGVRAVIDIYKPDDSDSVKIYEILRKERLLEANQIGRNPYWLMHIIQNQQYHDDKERLLKKSVDDAVDKLIKRETNEPYSYEKQIKIKNFLAFFAYQMTSNNDFFTYESATGMINSRLHEENILGITGEEIIGASQDAQILEYFPRSEHQQEQIQSFIIRFNHLLLQSYLTAWEMRLQTDKGISFQKELLNEKFLDLSYNNIVVWDSLVFLGDMVTDVIELLDYIIGEGKDLGRLLVGLSVLQNRKRKGAAEADKIDAILSDFVKKSSENEEKKSLQIFQKIPKAINDEVINELKKLLNTQESQKRNNVIRILAYTRSPSVLQDIVGLIEDKDITVRNEAIRALGIMENPSVLENLIRILNSVDENPGIIQSTVWAIGEIKDEKVIDILLKKIDYNNIILLREIGDALRKIGKNATDRLLHDLDSSDRKIRYRAANALVLIGISLDSSKNDYGYFAMKTLMDKIKLGEDDSLWSPEKRVDWKVQNEHVRTKRIEICNATFAVLSKSDNNRGISTLLYLADTTGDTQIKAMNTLADMGKNGVKHLISFLGHDRHITVDHAKDALKTICRNDIQSIDLLVNALQDKNDLIRKNAAEVLGEIGKNQRN